MNFKKMTLILLVALGIGFIVQADDSQKAGKKIRILGVGNSFTTNATRFLPEIIEADKNINADIAVAYIGGSPMDLHVRLAEKHEKNPEEGKKYIYKYNGKNKKDKKALKEILLDGKWDYVTIQQVSHKSYKQESFYPYAKELYDYIKKYAPDATLVMHETWTHRIDCSRTKQWNLPPSEMYKKLHANYTKVAKELGIGVIPVGTAMEIAKSDDLWNFQLPEGFDMTKLKYPEDKDKIPDQSKSLHSGYRWVKDKENPELKILRMDGFHANGNGQYLGGLVWYKYFFKKDPKSLPFKPTFLTEEQDKSLKKITCKVFNNKKH